MKSMISTISLGLGSLFLTVSASATELRCNAPVDGKNLVFVEAIDSSGTQSRELNHGQPETFNLAGVTCENMVNAINKLRKEGYQEMKCGIGQLPNYPENEVIFVEPEGNWLWSYTKQRTLGDFKKTPEESEFKLKLCEEITNFTSQFN